MRLHLKLFTDHELTRYKRVMPTWIPWALVGGGVMIGGAGALAHARARDDFSSYDAAIAACTKDPYKGCENPAVDVIDRKNQAENEQTLAIVAYSVGGVALVTGITLAIINRPESYRIDPFAEKARGVSIAPAFGPGVAGIVAHGSF
jgi:hypothetical protein